MSLNFGKLNFSTSLKPTSAFPLDARSYFESLADAQAAAATAEAAGSTSSIYYYGQILAIVDLTNNLSELYVITPSKTLQKLSSQDSIFYLGYYNGVSFYSDASCTEELTADTTKIYVNIKNDAYEFYKYYSDITGSGYKPSTPPATAEIAGKVKLYTTHGTNTDGTMTQKAITEGVQAIKLVVEEDSTCLSLNSPW